MKTRFMIALLAATTVAPAAAFAQASTATGAVGGAVVGGVVGGPVGAVVGAGVGATVGSAAEPPNEVVTYVEHDTTPSITMQDRVVVGEAVPSTVELRPVPQHTEYRYAIVNNQRIIVDGRSHKVVKIIE